MTLKDAETTENKEFKRTGGIIGLTLKDAETTENKELKRNRRNNWFDT